MRSSIIFVAFVSSRRLLFPSNKGSEPLRRYFNYASASFCSSQILSQWKCPNCIGSTKGTRVYKIMNSTKYGTRGYLAFNSRLKEIIIGYRGSVNIKNFVNSFNLQNYNYTDKIKLHYGTFLSARSLYPQTRRYLDELVVRYPSYRIVFVGHSLGGAIATVAAFLLLATNQIRPDSTYVFSYGSPRIGNVEFVYEYNRLTNINNSFRVVTSNDLVPSTPPRFANFAHVRTEIYLDDQNTYLCNNNNRYIEDPMCYASNRGNKSFADGHFRYLGYKLDVECKTAF